jgi:hypothetical protein
MVSFGTVAAAFTAAAVIVTAIAVGVHYVFGKYWR